jgi:hypothetical protein
MCPDRTKILVRKMKAGVISCKAFWAMFMDCMCSRKPLEHGKVGNDIVLMFSKGFG